MEKYITMKEGRKCSETTTYAVNTALTFAGPTPGEFRNTTIGSDRAGP